MAITNRSLKTEESKFHILFKSGKKENLEKTDHSALYGAVGGQIFHRSAPFSTRQGDHPWHKQPLLGRSEAGTQFLADSALWWDDLGQQPSTHTPDHFPFSHLLRGTEWEIEKALMLCKHCSAAQTLLALLCSQIQNTGPQGQL